jgi:hypothetical protein
MRRNYFPQTVHFLRKQTLLKILLKVKKVTKSYISTTGAEGGKGKLEVQETKKETKKIRQIIPIALAMIQYEENISSWHASKEGQRLA